MRSFVVCLALLTWPAAADDAPKSEAGTQFLQRCLQDVTDHRIATLKRQAPEYAASLPDEELQAGGMFTARKTCPCFLQIIAVASDTSGETPEEKVGDFLAYLDGLKAETAAPMPPIVSRLTRLCGVRSSVLPERWIKK